MQGTLFGSGWGGTQPVAQPMAQPVQSPFGFQASVGGSNPNGSFELPALPSDTITKLAWSPTGTLLAASSWDKTVRVWDIQDSMPGTGGGNNPAGVSGGRGLNANPKCSYSHDHAALSVAFTNDCVISGGCDNKVRVYSMAAMKDVVVGSHDMPVKEVLYCEELKLAISGGWDKTLKFWSLQTGTMAASLPLPDKVYCMDLRYPVLVVALADQQILVYNLATLSQNPAPMKTFRSVLKLQTRTIAVFSDRLGFVMGSIEGRTSVVAFDDTQKNLSFTFKCHRHPETEIYPVHVVDSHPTILSTFLTVGGDGSFVFWDKSLRRRIKQSAMCGAPVVAAKISPNGEHLAYAVGYDWCKGFEGNSVNIPKKAFVHRLTADDLRTKPDPVPGRR